MTLNQWALRHQISANALAELCDLFNLDPPPPQADALIMLGSEAAVQAWVRVECSRRGWRVFRNNLGAGKLEDGSFIRWGLCNESAQVNKQIKSSDLIGWDNEGRFVALECKAPGWRYTGTDREKAQRKWLELVVAAGGIGKFINGPEQLA